MIDSPLLPVKRFFRQRCSAYEISLSTRIGFSIYLSRILPAIASKACFVVISVALKLCGHSREQVENSRRALDRMGGEGLQRLSLRTRQETERDTKFVELGRFLCAVFAGSTGGWRI
jgi:hypothetical protein